MPCLLCCWKYRCYAECNSCNELALGADSLQAWMATTCLDGHYTCDYLRFILITVSSALVAAVLDINTAQRFTS
jgi:hypothetical protein